MKRSEVLAWLQQHGGQKGTVNVVYVDVPNPSYDGITDKKQTTKGKRVTWTANDGETLTVMDTGEMTTPPLRDPNEPGGIEPGDRNTRAPRDNPAEPIYEVVGKPEKEVAPRTPEKERDDQMIIAEKERNYAAGNGWKTDADVKRDTEEASERTRRTNVDAATAANQTGHLQIAQSAEARAAATDTRTANQQAHSNANDDARLEIQREEAERAKARDARPSVIGTPTEDNAHIGMFDPTTGKITSVDNPLYDEAKANAKRMQEELALAIQMNKLNADQAAQIYTQWFKANVEVPFMQASESRAQAADKRAALEAVDRKRQFAAQNSLQRGQLGQQAASTMVNAEIGMLPYRVGPAYGDQMSAAITGLAHGGTLNGPKADAGINFTKDAFEYDAPDLKKIAKNATKAALKGITPYDPGDEEIPTADYSGINMPGAGVMQTAPAQPNYIDTNSMYQNWMNSRYAGPTR